MTVSYTFNLWDRIRPHTVISISDTSMNTLHTNWPQCPSDNLLMSRETPLCIAGASTYNFMAVGQSELNIAGESGVSMDIRGSLALHFVI